MTRWLHIAHELQPESAIPDPSQRFCCKSRKDQPHAYTCVYRVGLVDSQGNTFDDAAEALIAKATANQDPQEILKLLQDIKTQVAMQPIIDATFAAKTATTAMVYHPGRENLFIRYTISNDPAIQTGMMHRGQICQNTYTPLDERWIITSVSAEPLTATQPAYKTEDTPVRIYYGGRSTELPPLVVLAKHGELLRPFVFAEPIMCYPGDAFQVSASGNTQTIINLIGYKEKGLCY